MGIGHRPFLQDAVAKRGLRDPNDPRLEEMGLGLHTLFPGCSSQAWPQGPQRSQVGGDEAGSTDPLSRMQLASVASGTLMICWRS
jgi:hypothetical protein